MSSSWYEEDLSSPQASPRQRRSIASSPNTREMSLAMKRQARDLLIQTDRRSRRSIVNVGNPWEAQGDNVGEGSSFDESTRNLITIESSSNESFLYGSISTSENKQESPPKEKRRTSKKRKKSKQKEGFFQQVPAIAVICLLNLMLSVPFGVSYFPVGWKADTDAEESAVDEDGVSGAFPLPGKEALGIRMFLFATMMGQLAFAFKSKFHNAIGLQMVENVPFCHALAFTVITEQGYGLDALSTLFFLFGLSSVVVGVVFYVLGKLELGRIVYFFPTHVLVGCIGGIGVFIAITALEVTINSSFSWDIDGFVNLWDRRDHFFVILGFDAVLRILMWTTQDDKGRPRFPLLSPIYFCLITPMFYLGIWVFGKRIEDAKEAQYFFPTNDDGGDWTEGLWDIWRVGNVATVSWAAVVKAIPTMIALAAFSLIHVPINIPAFAISTNVDTDMNAELIAHGYSNVMSGVFGGLQNYMTYANSVLYAKSGGGGKVSSVSIAVMTAVLFVVGPQVATYIPRCMAGTLLWHIGIDLFLEGVYDSYGNYDHIEYAGIWVITIVMTSLGMTAALIAGVIAALSTYAVQSITYQNPIRGTMTAETLRSSAWTRCATSVAVLDNPHIGRSRIFVIQLHGHLFFGNVAQLTDSIKEMLTEKRGTDDEPWIVIIDFGLVIGMDSSAAHAVAKLKGIMHRIFGVEHTIFVTGSGVGFPCEYALSRELSAAPENNHETDEESTDFLSCASHDGLSGGPTNRVCENLDTALIIAENMLIARQDSSLVKVGVDDLMCPELDFEARTGTLSLQEEKEIGIKYLANLAPDGSAADIEYLFSLFVREFYKVNETVWTQGSPSDSVKLLVRGTLFSSVEGTDVTESVRPGNTIGELGLVQGMNRLSTVRCLAESALVYSLSKERWEALTRNNPRVSRFLDGIVIRYLANRVQHVSNRIFETRCLPI